MAAAAILFLLDSSQKLFRSSEIPREQPYQIWMQSKQRFISYGAHKLFRRPSFFKWLRKWRGFHTSVRGNMITFLIKQTLCWINVIHDGFTEAPYQGKYRIIVVLWTYTATTIERWPFVFNDKLALCGFADPGHRSVLSGLLLLQIDYTSPG